jgi:hypothetical protein
MKPEGSQKPATGNYPASIERSPLGHILFL